VYLQNSFSVINDVTDIISCRTHGQNKWINFFIIVFHSHYKQFDKWVLPASLLMHLLSFSRGSVMQIWILYENEKCLKMNRQLSFASRWFTAMSFRMVCVYQPSRDWPYKRRKAIFLFTCEQIRCVKSQRIFWLHQDWWCVPVKLTSHNWSHTRPHVKLAGVSVVWYCCFF